MHYCNCHNCTKVLHCNDNIEPEKGHNEKIHKASRNSGLQNFLFFLCFNVFPWQFFSFCTVALSKTTFKIKRKF